MPQKVKMKPLPWIVMILIGAVISFFTGFLLGFVLFFFLLIIFFYGMSWLFPNTHKITIYRAGIAYEDMLQSILAPWEVITGIEKKSMEIKVNTTMKGGNFSVPKKHPKAQEVIDAVQGWLAFRSGAPRPWG